MSLTTSRHDLPMADTNSIRVQSPINERQSNETEAPMLESEPVPSSAAPGGIRFWLIMISLMVATFLGALDLTSVSTALPVMVQDLHGTDFVWVGAAFSLGSTAFLPLSGGLAQIFGRKPVILGSLAFFAIGSAIAGAAQNMNMLIAGRTIQGVGGGGILSLSEIIISDLVELRQRGIYMGLISGVWAIASAVGPPIGGVFAQHNWRWLFYMNLPLTAVALVLVFSFLHLKAPKSDFKNQIKRLDWIGNGLVIGGTTSLILALARAGVQYSWASYQTLVPLICGVLGLVAFMVWEAKWASDPVVPWELVNNRTSFFAFITVVLHGIVSTAAIYYFPVYFQGAQLQWPVRAGVSLFGLAFTIAPAAVVCGFLVAKLNRYVPQNVAGWVLTTVGFGIMSMLTVSSPQGWQEGFQIILGIGLGFLFPGPTYPVLAAVPISESAHALALFTFVRNLAQTFGVTIGSTILQNELKRKLPPTFLETVSAEGAAEIAYSVIPVVGALPEPLKAQVRDAFAGSVQMIWRVMIGLSAAGLLAALAMQELKMHEATDEDWGMAEREKQDEEKVQRDAEKV
ncbi:hypothetical protein FRB95_011989 [Tulasnella sp. JGI-2019a]|nr:hypothetical protein FRB95_011989 [Tulasnella sp. JGI-2019a]